MTFSFYQRCTQHSSYQIFRHEIEGHRAISHRNLLPVIEVSETPFPFCVMSPWMPGGNIIQYTQMNPDGDRLTLVRVHQLEDRRG